jgi:hypothetical protein
VTEFLITTREIRGSKEVCRKHPPATWFGCWSRPSSIETPEDYICGDHRVKQKHVQSALKLFAQNRVRSLVPSLDLGLVVESILLNRARVVHG